MIAVSPWVASCVQAWLGARSAEGLKALDLACGSGRHANWLASLGLKVHAVDRQTPDQSDWAKGVHFEAMDLETDTWPLPASAYDVVVVTNYLYRPHFQNLLRCLKSENALVVYETFMDGNAQFGSPRNPDFLLKSGELAQLLLPLNLIRFEQGLRGGESPAMIQRAMAITGNWSAIQSQAIELNNER